MEKWILVTLAAVFFQVIRHSLQKSLKKNLDDLSITWIRFLFSLPFALILIYFLQKFQLWHIADFSIKFWLYIFLAASTQILGSYFLLKVFAERNFTVGISFLKTETLQTALIGVVFFSESLNLSGIVALIIGSIGLVFLSIAKTSFSLKRITQGSAAKYGLACGFVFALAALFIKEAVIVSNIGNKLSAAVTILIFMNLVQNIILLAVSLKQKLCKIRLQQMHENFKNCLTVGILSFIGSIFWFYAFAIANVSYVKLIGQTEIVISYFISNFFFKERMTNKEIIAISLIILSLFLLIIFP